MTGEPGQPERDDPRQRTFAQLAAEESRAIPELRGAPPIPLDVHRRAEHELVLEEARASADGSEWGPRDDAIASVRAHLENFIRRLGVGATFQAVDFTRWMTESNLWPGADVYDRRSTGGHFVQLLKAGVLESVGAKPNGGCKASGYNSTIRSVWRIKANPSGVRSAAASSPRGSEVAA